MLALNPVSNIPALTQLGLFTANAFTISRLAKLYSFLNLAKKSWGWQLRRIPCDFQTRVRSLVISSIYSNYVNIPSSSLLMVFGQRIWHLFTNTWGELHDCERFHRGLCNSIFFCTAKVSPLEHQWTFLSLSEPRWATK